MTSDIDALTALFQEGLVNMFVQGLTLAIVAVVLFVVSPTLAAVLFLGVVPVMFALTIWFRRASDVAFLDVRERIADVMSDLQENLGGIRIVTATNRAKRNVVAHDNVLGRHRDANDRTAVIGAVYGPSTEMLGYLAQAMLLGLGGWLVSEGRLSIGELAAFFLYLTMFFAPIQQLVQLYNTYQQGRSAVRKLSDLFATEPEVVEAPGAPPLPPMQGAIDLDHVSFGYEPGVPVLRDLDLHIRAGETVAFVGETGAGKSTVAKLVNRYYDPVDGTVRIDGHDLRDVTLDSVRSQIGVVPQEAFLFAGSIKDNLTFAAPDATDEQLWEAVDAVGLRDLVERQPEGLDQVIHERGSSLSSGERQLLALARAFLSQPRVLVLDEATSNLDLQSETRIERALDAVLEGRTAIIIAHRLATAMRADRIAVIHDGELVELGSHDELVARGGRYAALFDTWMSQASA
jgi:ATP-binding cassette, subfamily B, bacterial